VPRAVATRRDEGLERREGDADASSSTTAAIETRIRDEKTLGPSHIVVSSYVVYNMAGCAVITSSLTFS